MKFNKRLIISVTAVLVLTAGVGFAIWHSETTREGEDDSVEITSEDPSQPITEADEREGQAGEVEGNDQQSENNHEESSQSTRESSSDTRTVNPTLTSLNQNQNQVMVRALVDGATSGTCTVVFEKSGYSSVTREAQIGLQGSTYICQGFDVAKSAFPTKGSWNVKVRFSSADARGVSRTESIHIN